MNPLQKRQVWALFTALFLALLGSSHQSVSAKPIGQFYIGVYQRTAPGRRGPTTIVMDVRRGGSVVERRTGPRGRTTTERGTWKARGENIWVSLRGNKTAYHLDRNNLTQVNNTSVFFKKTG